jgi:hypothetical protein
LRLFELLLPGSGLTTTIPKRPAEDAEPVAASCVVETNVVVSGMVASMTCAPWMKFVPVTMRLKVPVPTLAGFAPASVGVGFNRVTALEAVSVLRAALVAVIVSVLGLGSDAGAV